MQKMLMISAVIATAVWGGCSKDRDSSTGALAARTISPTETTAPTSSDGSKSGLDVSVTPAGQADVYITDENGKRVNGNGATGKVELPDGSTVPLTPSAGGEHMTAPLGDHASHASRGCNATVRVTPPNGPERMARLDMCRGMDPARMGPGEMEHGGGERSGEMGHRMDRGAGTMPGPSMGAKPGHGS